MSVSGQETKVDDQLRLAWLQQLQSEYEDICFQYRLTLKPPIFELSDSATILGSWNTRHRLLSISSHLIRRCPWSISLQVLKHEMAHQISVDCFSKNDGRHGAVFQQACTMVGLSGPFCRAAADCSGLPAQEAADVLPRTGQGRKILARVEKLLALAASDNEHEAALAMQRAGELLVRHNLTILKQGNSAYDHRSLNTGCRRMPGHFREICSLLQDFFLVRVICASTYEPMRDVEVRTIELFGRPENVAVAEHCYFFLTEKMHALWRENKQRFVGGGLRARNSYFHGLLTGFRQKLTKSANRADEKTGCRQRAGSFARLIVLGDKGLEEFVGVAFPRLRKGRSRKIILQGDAYRQAVATGRSLVLHRVVAGEASHGGVLGPG